MIKAHKTLKQLKEAIGQAEVLACRTQPYLSFLSLSLSLRGFNHALGNTVHSRAPFMAGSVVFSPLCPSSLLIYSKNYTHHCGLKSHLLPFNQ